MEETLEEKTNAGKFLRVMTYNIRHGRGKRGVKSPIMRMRRALDNLGNVAGMLLKEKPHIVMLQEADGNSFLTGRFNHVKALAELGGYRHYFLGRHVRERGLAYGTALLSEYQLQNPSSTKLETTLPIFKKGYVSATVSLPQFGNQITDLVSAHFASVDLTPKRTRREQADYLVRALKRRKNPLIIGGDFNCDYRAREDTLRYIADELGLEIPSEIGAGARLPSGNGRYVDWILVSREFDICDCRYVAERFSDHYPLVVELGKKN